MMVEFSVVPVSQDGSVAKYIAEAVRVVDESGLDYRVTPMGTVIRGDWDEVMAVVKAAHEKVRSMTDRVITKIYIDESKSDDPPFDEKVASVEKVIGKEIKK